MGQEKYEVWFAGIRGLGARKKYLLHEALKSCRNAYYIEETQLKKFPFLTEKDGQEIRQAQKRKDPEKICEEMKKKGIRIIPYYSEKYPPKYTKEKATAEAGAAHSGNLRSNHFWHDVMPGTEDVEKPVYRKEPVYATKYYYEIDKWTVVDTAKSSGNDQNPSWPEPKLKDGQRTGAEEEHYFVTATYEKKKGKTETGRYEMDFSQWKELKKGCC